MGPSPSPTFADVYSDHEMYALARKSLEKVFGGPVVREVIQNWSGLGGVLMKVRVLDSAVLKENGSIVWL